MEILGRIECLSGYEAVAWLRQHKLITKKEARGLLELFKQEFTSIPAGHPLESAIQKVALVQWPSPSPWLN